MGGNGFTASHASRTAHSSLKNEIGIVERRRRGKEDAVETVEYPAVPGNYGAGILNSAAPLQKRFEKIAQLTEQAEQEGRSHAVRDRKHRKKSRPGDQGADDTTRQSAERSLYALVGTDDRVELRPPQGGADVIGGTVSCHDDHHHEENPLHAGGEAVQEDKVPEEERNIQKAHEDKRDLTRGPPDIPDPEEKEEGKGEDQGGKPERHAVREGSDIQERQERAGHGGDPPFQPALRQGHPVELAESQKDQEQYEGGEEGMTRPEKEEDQEG